MSAWEPGDAVPLEGEFRKGDALFDPPNVYLTVKAPDGGETDFFYPAGGLAHPSLGVFRKDYPLADDALTGRYHYWWACDGDGQAAEPASFDVRPLIAPNWRPTVDDVGAIIRARTKTRLSETFEAGNEIGTFNEKTRPTGDEVERLIDEATDDVANAVGVTICEPALEISGRRVAALGTALLIELSYFPEQIRADQSPYEALERRYKDRLARLVTAVAEKCGDADSGGSPGGLLPTHTMPCGGYDGERF